MSMIPTARTLRCRQIVEADLDAVVSLLTRGFPDRDSAFWRNALALLGGHEPPSGLAKYGYLMESGGEAVGVVLLICSATPDSDGPAIRCNLSSWYVDPPFRAYAPILVSQAIRNKDVTYLNVSPAPHTRAIIEAQGFSCYSHGVFVAVPLLHGFFGRSKAQVFDGNRRPDVKHDQRVQQLLERHATYGCVSLWCVADGRAYPFVFRRRRLYGFIPIVQLIYCSDLSDFVHFAGPVGYELARRGVLLAIMDANAPVAGLAGFYMNGHRPKYFKGPKPPRLGDLAYTEYAMMGATL
jgi:hypothetical protein